MTDDHAVTPAATPAHSARPADSRFGPAHLGPAHLGPARIRRPNAPENLHPHDLRGANLRYSLLTLLHQQGPASIGELIERLERLGLTVGGRDPAKTVGDVLRYEWKLGRVRRIGRGRYAGLERPDTTTRRHRDRLRALIAAR